MRSTFSRPVVGIIFVCQAVSEKIIKVQFDLHVKYGVYLTHTNQNWFMCANLIRRQMPNFIAISCVQTRLRVNLNLLTSTTVASPSNVRNTNVYFRVTFVSQRWQPSLSIWQHNVSTLNESWKQSCVIFVCRHSFSYQRDPN